MKKQKKERPPNQQMVCVPHLPTTLQDEFCKKVFSVGVPRKTQTQSSEPKMTSSFITGATDNGSQSFTSNPLAPGIDRRSQYFTTRSITFGLNLDF